MLYDCQLVDLEPEPMRTEWDDDDDDALSTVTERSEFDSEWVPGCQHADGADGRRTEQTQKQVQYCTWRLFASTYTFF